MDSIIAQQYEQRLALLKEQLATKGKTISAETEKSFKKKIENVRQLDNELEMFVEKFKIMLDSGALINKDTVSEADIDHVVRITKRLKHNVLIISDGLIKISSNV